MPRSETMPYSSDARRWLQCLCSRPSRPERSRNSTSSSPSTLTRIGRSPTCSVIATGIQKRRKYSPHGVPGPVWVSSGSSRAPETRWYPL